MGLPVSISPEFLPSCRAARGKLLAVGTERHAPNRFGMTLEFEQKPTGVGIPDVCCLVLGARRDEGPIVVERHAFYFGRMPF